MPSRRSGRRVPADIVGESADAAVRLPVEFGRLFASGIRVIGDVAVQDKVYARKILNPGSGAVLRSISAC